MLKARPVSSAERPTAIRSRSSARSWPGSWLSSSRARSVSLGSADRLSVCGSPQAVPGEVGRVRAGGQERTVPVTVPPGSIVADGGVAAPADAADASAAASPRHDRDDGEDEAEPDRLARPARGTCVGEPGGAGGFRDRCACRITARGRAPMIATLERLRVDCQLDEALASSPDPLHLAAAFGLDEKTAIRCADAARQLLESSAEQYVADGSPRTQGSTPGPGPSTLGFPLRTLQFG
jgi:hypothetical protein